MCVRERKRLERTKKKNVYVTERETRWRETKMLTSESVCVRKRLTGESVCERETGWRETRDTD